MSRAASADAAVIPSSGLGARKLHPGAVLFFPGLEFGQIPRAQEPRIGKPEPGEAFHVVGGERRGLDHAASLGMDLLQNDDTVRSISMDRVNFRVVSDAK